VAIDLETYRDELEEMTAETLTEYYEHNSGRKPTLEMARIYERYGHLTTLESAVELAEMAAPVQLQRFAAEAYIGDGTSSLTDDVANREASLTVPFDGGDIPYREVQPRLLNEPDRERRTELYRRRCEATEAELNPLLEAVAVRERELTAELGATTVLELYERFGFDPVGLRANTDAFLEATEPLYVDELERQLRDRLGLAVEDARPPDLTRLHRAPEFDPAFPLDRAIPALRATLEGLGIDIDRQANVELDLEPRRGKQPRAFCAPIRVPDRVVLVTLPQGGQEDYGALFHEAGHTEHFAYTQRSLPAEQRLLGDNGVTEGFAFLLEHLVSNPQWLSARLDMPRSEEFVRFSAFMKLLIVRRYAGKLAYELELHRGAALESLPQRYAELQTAAVGVPFPTSDYLEDVDGGFYCTCYLRAWAFEAQLSAWLRERWGGSWFRRREAGMLLREVWELGQSLDADELLREITGERIEFSVLADEARAALS
jgi:hypothetical protein